MCGREASWSLIHIFLSTPRSQKRHICRFLRRPPRSEHAHGAARAWHVDELLRSLTLVWVHRSALNAKPAARACDVDCWPTLLRRHSDELQVVRASRAGSFGFSLRAMLPDLWSLVQGVAMGVLCLLWSLRCIGTYSTHSHAVGSTKAGWSLRWSQLRIRAVQP